MVNNHILFRISSGFGKTIHMYNFNVPGLIDFHLVYRFVHNYFLCIFEAECLR